ncbi:general secretion pathway protein GspE, partial [Corallococcus llansteffanensis]
AEAPRAAPNGSPAELLKSVEEVQRKEVAALKAMVELLIEKGIFSREEYLAKVKR